MKVYTKTGDDGTTGLYGGARTGKDAPRVAAYGSVDEANAAIGLARANLGDADVDRVLARIQRTLFDVGADLATPADAPQRGRLHLIDDEDVEGVEVQIDRFDHELEALKQFVIPGGHVASAALHVARSVVRRAEREVVALGREEAVNEAVVRYLNRVSDLLFVLARTVNARTGVSETRWLVERRAVEE
ncbi:MAG: cob(I)yrinic acid a,c-diamide adenosyltransferase [Trueperaceae bacterium]|nr:cob(I)yrinic acid a,c-diamide adenosyltransferase [Trueperaceae bacterium]